MKYDDGKWREVDPGNQLKVTKLQGQVGKEERRK